MKKNLLGIIALLLAMLMIGAAAAETVTVAFNPEYPPFESVDGENYVGYDVDMINAIAEKAGFDVEFEAMDFDAVIAAVMTNKDTIGVSGISITDERKLNVNFSQGYINAGLIVVIKKDSGYATTEDLKGKVIGVQQGTTSDFAAEEITGMENVAQYKTFLNAIMDLQGNKIDAVIVDKPVGMAILASLNDATLEIVDMGLQADWYGIEVNKDNAELLEKIDSILYYGAHPKIGHAVKTILGGGADQYDHWDRVWAERVLWFYVKDMLRTGGSEEDILQGLKGNILRLTDRPKNMAEWMVRVGKMTEFVHNVQ